MISIHALLAESDHYDNYNLHCTEISIHALLAESDLFSLFGVFLVCIFLSTLSLRRATWDLTGGLSCDAYFYPRSPCGERQPTSGILRFNPLISIHALLAESDIKGKPADAGHLHFYPRSPCGERHLRVLDGSKSSIISIHALLAESDEIPSE